MVYETVSASFCGRKEEISLSFRGKKEHCIISKVFHGLRKERSINRKAEKWLL
jgi:hypothetical protein